MENAVMGVTLSQVPRGRLDERMKGENIVVGNQARSGGAGMEEAAQCERIIAKLLGACWEESRLDPDSPGLGPIDRSFISVGTLTEAREMLDGVVSLRVLAICRAEGWLKRFAPATCGSVFRFFLHRLPRPYYSSRDHSRGAGAWCVRGPNGYELSSPGLERTVSIIIASLLSGNSFSAKRELDDHICDLRRVSAWSSRIVP